MKIIIFVRHGQSEANVNHVLSSDIDKNPLTALGVSQAEETARVLSNYKIDQMFTSPVLRARQTAEIIARPLGFIPKTDNRLIERDFGDLNNKKFDSTEISESVMEAELKSSDINGPETWDSMKKRMSEFMYSMPDNAITIAASHRDPIASAMAVIDSKYDDDFISTSVLKIPNASITVINPDKKVILSAGSNQMPDLSN